MCLDDLVSEIQANVRKCLTKRNCVGDIFLHKSALLHVSYHSLNRKQSDKVKVKVTKSKIYFNFDVAANQLAKNIHFRAKLF